MPGIMPWDINLMGVNKVDVNPRSYKILLFSYFA